METEKGEKGQRSRWVAVQVWEVRRERMEIEVLSVVEEALEEVESEREMLKVV